MDFTSIFEFENYRLYLLGWLEMARELKVSNLSRLAEVARVHATFLSQVLAAGKDLSLEQAALISQHFEHTKLEREYFFTLIQLDRAGNSELKTYWLDRKTEILEEKNRLARRFEKHQQLTAEQAATFYSSWIFSAARISCAIQGGQTLTQLAERLQISRLHAEKMMSFLVSTGLCDEREGKYMMGETHLHVPNESPFVHKHHTNWRLRALESMEQRQSDELFFTAPMSIARADFARLRERLNQFIKEAVEIAKESEAEELVDLNIDFYRPRR